jgi:hypothetical protein
MGKEEIIRALKDGKATLGQLKTKEDVLALLKAVGQAVGYKPMVRALVMDKPEDQWLKW